MTALFVNQETHIFCMQTISNGFTPTDAVAFNDAHFGAGTGTVYLDEVRCSGSESKLADCSRSSSVSCYRHWWYRYSHVGAGVRCQGKYQMCQPILCTNYFYVFMIII